MSQSAHANKRSAKQEKPRSKRPRQSSQTEVVDRQSQFTLQMRESLHRELARKALDSGMTMRGFIMNALRKAGLNVTDIDLVDRRRR